MPYVLEQTIYFSMVFPACGFRMQRPPLVKTKAEVRKKLALLEVSVLNDTQVFKLGVSIPLSPSRDRTSKFFCTGICVIFVIVQQHISH